MKLIILYLLFFLTSSIFAQSVLPFRRGNYWGYQNAEGQVLVAPRYDTAYTFEYQKAIVAYQNLSNASRRFGLINEKGEEILPCTYDSIWVYPNGCAMATDAKNPKGILYDINGKEIWKAHPKHTIIQAVPPLNAPADKLKQGLTPLVSFLFYYDNNTDTLSPNWSFSDLIMLDSQQNYLIALTPQLTWRLIDTQGRAVLPIEFDSLYPVFRNRRAFQSAGANFMFQKGDTFYAVDNQAQVFWRGKGDSLRIFPNGTAFLFRKEGNMFLNYSQKSAKRVDFDNMFGYNEERKNLFVKKRDKYGVCDVAGELILSIKYDKIEEVDVISLSTDPRYYQDSATQFRNTHYLTQIADSQYVVNVEVKKQIPFSNQLKAYCYPFGWVITNKIIPKKEIYTNQDVFPPLDYAIYKDCKFLAKVQLNQQPSIFLFRVTPNYLIIEDDNRILAYNKQGKKFVFSQFTADNSPVNNVGLKEVVEINDDLVFSVSYAHNRYALISLKYGLLIGTEQQLKIGFIGEYVYTWDENKNVLDWYKLESGNLAVFNSHKLSGDLTSNQDVEINLIFDAINHKISYLAVQPTKAVFELYDEKGKNLFKVKNLDKFEFDFTTIKVYNQKIVFLEQINTTRADKFGENYFDEKPKIEKYRYIFNFKGQQLLASEFKNNYKFRTDRPKKTLIFDENDNKVGLLDLDLGTIIFPARFDEILYKQEPENAYTCVEQIDEFSAYETVCDQTGKVICRQLYEQKQNSLAPKYVRSRVDCQRISPYIYDYELAKNGVIYTIPKLSYLNEKGECVENCDLLAPQN